MFLIGTRNIASQDLVVNGLVDLGQVYRKRCRKNQCGVKVFDFSSTSIALQHTGIYHVTAVLTFTAPVAGDVTFQLTENGVAIPGALATETITTAATETKTTTLDFYILVDNNCVLGAHSVQAKNIAILNSGVASTVTNAVLNIEKVV